MVRANPTSLILKMVQRELVYQDSRVLRRKGSLHIDKHGLGRIVSLERIPQECKKDLTHAIALNDLEENIRSEDQQAQSRYMQEYATKERVSQFMI